MARLRQIPPIKTIADLKRHLQLAVEIEHATIPPYLTALYSIKDGANLATSTLIKQILIEEMLHFSLACNLLNALGEPPRIAHSRFIPRYPTPLPESDACFSIHIERCCDCSLQTFMRIERPKYPLPLSVNRTIGYRTIGEFYDNIKVGFCRLYETMGNAIFKGNPTWQLLEGYFGGRGRLIAVTDLDSAITAIDVIVDQGEGAGVPLPNLPADERPHFFSFSDILSRSIIGGDGHPLPAAEQFQPQHVWPMVKNPRLAGPRVRLLSREFNEHYSQLLEILQDTFTGNPSRIWDALNVMRECRESCIRLMQTPIGNGLNAGPTFEYISAGRSRKVAIPADIRPVAFGDIREILDEAIADWISQHGRIPDLQSQHQSSDFGWSTREELLAATARGFRLIDPCLIGNGMGHQTNLVIALRSGLAPFGGMPDGGPSLCDEDIGRIVAWINAGCPDRIEPAYTDPAFVEQSVEMLMRDPEVNRQSDLVPYPYGPGKLIHKWLVSVRFRPVEGSPIQIKVFGISGGTAGVRSGNSFDGIARDNVYQDTSNIYHGNPVTGCLVLHKAAVPEVASSAYDPNADHFPNPAISYPFRAMTDNGRWFRVEWRISVDETGPNLSVAAVQQPRVANVSERRCP